MSGRNSAAINVKKQKNQYIMNQITTIKEYIFKTPLQASKRDLCPVLPSFTLFILNIFFTSLFYIPGSIV